MENRVYYGEYSLEHWIGLILNGNITLPRYQRYFVWDEGKVKKLIKTFKDKQFVPPVTIGSFKKENESQNLILDGQQRLTSILLAYLDLYPDKATYKNKPDKYANENDDEPEDNEAPDDAFEWTFSELTRKGKTKDELIKGSKDGYKSIGVEVTDDFLKNTFLGFSYLVPNVNDSKEQQKFYSSVFRHINIQGVSLLPQESRSSLYFLDESLTSFFNPGFCKRILVNNGRSDAQMDFVRYLALLSQYRKDKATYRIAKGYSKNMEKYYEEYIYSVVGDVKSELFDDFKNIFPDNKYEPVLALLEQTIDSLKLPKRFTSIIDLDVNFFGLIYVVLFDGKKIDVKRGEELRGAIQLAIGGFKGEPKHTRAPGALKYLTARMGTSIEIYKGYLDE